MKKAFATNLRKARAFKGWTQAVISSRIGIKLSTYQSYEEGRAEPSAQGLVTLAEILGITNLLVFLSDPEFDIKDQDKPPSIHYQSPLESNYAKLKGRTRQAVDILLGMDGKSGSR